jgi:hypothetical protein
MRMIDDGPDNLELDQMLRQLKQAPIPAPRAEIRQNLQRMTAMPRASHSHRLRWALSAAACLTVMAGVSSHYLHRSPEFMSKSQNVTSVATGTTPNIVPAQKLAAVPRKVHHASPHKPASPPSSFTVQLSYSNREIANGTNAIVSVKVSREELIALGVPTANETREGKYLAAVTLGDDGLPRSLQVPLPLKTLD